MEGNGVSGTEVITAAIGKKDIFSAVDRIRVLPAGIADLIIHKPKVLDASESDIPEKDELKKGGLTFVNLDNDDNDAEFDNVDNDVATGDNELTKLRLTLDKAVKKGEVKLTVLEGVSDIKIYTDNQKKNRYSIGNALSVPSDFTNDQQNKRLYKDLWIVGINSQKVQAGVKLRMDYFLGGKIMDSDRVGLTVVGIEKVEWIGEKNSVSDGDKLLDDPNWPTGLSPSSLRVFPDARANSLGVVENPRNKVDVKVTLSTPSPWPFKLYVKSFDTDDPTSDKGPVDDPGATTNETLTEDNRGTPRAGHFDKEKDGLGTLEFGENEIEKSIEFETTMQPGDNFRVAANGDPEFLKNLENNDSVQNIGSSDAEKNENKQRICNKSVAGTPEEREVRLKSNYCSNVLTVWRFLHIEMDSMTAPPTTGAERNTVEGTITAISGIFFSANRITVDQNLNDGSASPGRFEKGKITIGTSKDELTFDNLDGNGAGYVDKSAGFNIQATVTKNEQVSLTGKIMALSGQTYTFVIIPPLSDEYVGGTITVAGVSSTITAVTTGVNPTVTVDAPPNIPFTKLHDDDVDGVLPSLPSIENMQSADIVSKNRFNQVYIRPIYDGGGNAANNQNNVPCILNTENSSAYLWQSRNNNSSKFWVTYLLAAFQDSYQNNTKDFDPDIERGTWASANNKPMKSGVLLYIESQRDGLLSNDWKARVTIHEVGHNFGLIDQYNDPASDGIMYGYAPDGNSSDNYFFIDSDVNKIRKINNPK